MPQTLRFFSGEDVGRALSVKEAIPLMREAFIQLSTQQASVPIRTKIDVAGRDGTVLYMPVYLPARELLAVKVVSLFKGNAAAGLPLIHALVLLNDARTGRPLAVHGGGAVDGHTHCGGRGPGDRTAGAPRRVRGCDLRRRQSGAHAT